MAVWERGKMSAVLLLVLGFYIVRASAGANLTFTVYGVTTSCMGSSNSIAAVCLNQEVTFFCRTYGTEYLTWKISANGATSTLQFTNTSLIHTANPLVNPMLGVSFTAYIHTTYIPFMSELRATVDSNAYDGINVTCNDATLLLELVNGPPSPPINLRYVSQINQCGCPINRVCSTASAELMWECPVSTRGTSVTGFTVIVDVDGSTEFLVRTTDRFVTLNGLRINANHTATVTASNCNGMSEASMTTIFNNTALLPPTSVSSCRVDMSTIQINWGNPPQNEGLFCPVCQTHVRWTVDGDADNSVVAPSTATSYDIQYAVQNATYSVTVTYRAADGCEASSDTSFVNNVSLTVCSTAPTPGTTTPVVTDRLSVGAIAGISVTIGLVSFSAGVLLASLIACYYKERGGGKSYRQADHRPSEVLQPALVGESNMLELKENDA